MTPTAQEHVLTETPTSPVPPGLRDRLFAVLTEYEAKEPLAAVEAVCDQFALWLRQQAEVNAQEIGDTMLYGRAAAAVLDGLAQGITNAAPQVTDQDPGVSSDS